MYCKHCDTYALACLSTAGIVNIVIPTPHAFLTKCAFMYNDTQFVYLLQVQWLQWGVTFSQVVWLIGC